MGATLALAYAVKNPDKIKSLILIGPGNIKGSNLFIVSDNRFSRTTKVDNEVIKQWNDSIKNNQAVEKAKEEIRKIRLQWSLYDHQKADSIFQRVKLGKITERVAELIRNDKLDLTNDLKEFKKPI